MSRLDNKTSQQLEKIADRWFSWFIRLSYADFDGNCTCCTCKRKKPWKEMDNGHYVSRDRSQTRFSAKNCAPQCRYCNSYRHGMKEEHAQFIDSKYGDGTADNLKKIGAMPSHDLSAETYKAIIEELKIKVKQLEKEKGLRVYES